MLTDGVMGRTNLLLGISLAFAEIFFNQVLARAVDVALLIYSQVL
jgi:hypothetical protein